MRFLNWLLPSSALRWSREYELVNCCDSRDRHVLLLTMGDA